MIVRKLRDLNAGECFVDFALSEGILKIGAEEFNLAQLQEASQRIIDVKKDGMYLASIEIPPKTYHEEMLENGEEHTYSRVAEELDTDAVVLSLWPIACIDNQNLKEAE